MVKIVSGVNVMDLQLEGKTVADVRAMLAQALNIDPQANSLINGESVEANIVLSDGDELEFVKAAGEKGC
jgi:molybdopterin converting factor small subunit